MSDPPPAARQAITWSPEARAELRQIDRHSAISILHCIDRILVSRSGDVKRLQPPLIGLRLRCGDYRILFDQSAGDEIGITGVRHRRDAYR